MIVYQQGDVVLIKTEKILGEVLDTKVVQEGEHTGHAHRLNEFGSVYRSEANLYVKALKGARISHEEHLPIEIEEGEYEVRIVRQKDPFSKLISKVVDWTKEYVESVDKTGQIFLYYHVITTPYRIYYAVKSLNTGISGNVVLLMEQTCSYKGFLEEYRNGATTKDYFLFLDEISWVNLKQVAEESNVQLVQLVGFGRSELDSAKWRKFNNIGAGPRGRT